MERLTFRGKDGLWCAEGEGRKITFDSFGRVYGEAIDRLAAYEDTGLTPEEIMAPQTAFRSIEQGQYIKMPFVAMVEQSLKGGKMTPQKNQSHNGRYAVVYSDPKKWKSPLIDICGKHYDREEAEARMEELQGGAE